MRCKPCDRYGPTIFYYGHTSSGGRLWLISESYSGRLEFNKATPITFYEIIEGKFGAPVQPETLWGTITFTLENFNSGIVEFNGLDGLGEMNLVRIAGVPGESCLVLK